MPIPVTLGGTEYKSKTAAKDFFRALRDRYADGISIGEEDSAFLRELLACHPEADTKAGAGIAGFSVATETEFGRTRHFMVHRTDGTATDFSFITCIDGRSLRKDRLEALRRAVLDQIIAFRDEHFAGELGLCPLRGVPITWAAHHVDHAPPEGFLVLAEMWLHREKLDWPDVVITPSADNQVVARMTNVAQLASWTEFHRARAKLRMLSPLANLSAPKKG